MKTKLIAALSTVALAAAVAYGFTVYKERMAVLETRRKAIDETWLSLETELVERARAVVELARVSAEVAPDSGLAVASATEDLLRAADREGKFAANQQLAEHLAELLIVLRERPPTPDGPLRRLQDQLSGAEHQIAERRRSYNRAVQEYNTSLQLFPDNAVAWVAGLERETAYFRSTEAERQGAPAVRPPGEEQAAAEDVE